MSPPSGLLFGEPERIDNYPMRAPCGRCDSTIGRREDRNGQALIFCAQCGIHCYNAPKSETGEPQRTVATRPNIKPSTKVRIFDRDTSRCVLCGATPDRVELHVGHLIPVKGGREIGLSDDDLFGDENLACMCEECNLGLAAEPPSLRMMARVLMLRRRIASGA